MSDKYFLWLTQMQERDENLIKVFVVAGLVVGAWILTYHVGLSSLWRDRIQKVMIVGGLLLYAWILVVSTLS